MQVQPRYGAYAANRFFGDGMAMRKPPEGALAYSAAAEDAPCLDGRASGQYVTSFPVPIDRPLLEAGRVQFDVICAACHGVLGDGDSIVATFMERRPPSLHEPRIRELPPGRIYEVIREGYGFMPSYATHLNAKDTWAVVAYVRALQRSQHAVVARLPEFIADELRKAER